MTRLTEYRVDVNILISRAEAIFHFQFSLVKYRWKLYKCEMLVFCVHCLYRSQLQFVSFVVRHKDIVTNNDCAIVTHIVIALLPNLYIVFKYNQFRRNAPFVGVFNVEMIQKSAY